jgi:hypothetical protein
MTAARNYVEERDFYVKEVKIVSFNYSSYIKNSLKLPLIKFHF